jgi:hypothetical protein
MPTGFKIHKESPKALEGTALSVFEAILAGAPAEDVAPAVRRLDAEEFHMLMCTFCMMHQDVAEVCTDRANVIARVLNVHCRYYSNGLRTCAPAERGGLFPIP